MLEMVMELVMPQPVVSCVSPAAMLPVLLPAVRLPCRLVRPLLGDLWRWPGSSPLLPPPPHPPLLRIDDFPYSPPLCGFIMVDGRLDRKSSMFSSGTLPEDSSRPGVLLLLGRATVREEGGQEEHELAFSVSRQHYPHEQHLISLYVYR